MKNLHSIPAVLFLLLISFAVISAQGKGTGKDMKGTERNSKPGMFQGPGEMPFIQNLNLSKKQKEKFEAMHLDLQKEIIKLNSEIQINKIEIKRLFNEKQLNSGKLTDLTDTNGKIEQQIKKLRTENWIKVYTLLNDEQRETWKNHFERMMDQPMRGPGMMQNGAKGMMGKGPGMMRGQMQQNQGAKETTKEKE